MYTQGWAQTSKPTPSLYSSGLYQGLTGKTKVKKADFLGKEARFQVAWEDKAQVSGGECRTNPLLPCPSPGAKGAPRTALAQGNSTEEDEARPGSTTELVFCCVALQEGFPVSFHAGLQLEAWLCSHSLGSALLLP